MSINLNFKVSDALPQLTSDKNVQIVGYGKTKLRLNLLQNPDCALDSYTSQFMIACKRSAHLNCFWRFFYSFTHVKMIVEGEEILLNTRSAATRLGLTIEQVKRVAATNNIGKFQTMAQKRLAILKFFKKRDLDYANETHKIYYVWMRYASHHNDQIYHDLERSNIQTLSQFEFIKLDDYQGKTKIFEINGVKWAVASFDIKVGSTPSKPFVHSYTPYTLKGYIPIKSNVALLPVSKNTIVGNRVPASFEVHIDGWDFDVQTDKIGYRTFEPGLPTGVTFYSWAYRLTSLELSQYSEFKFNKPSPQPKPAPEPNRKNAYYDSGRFWEEFWKSHNQYRRTPNNVSKEKTLHEFINERKQSIKAEGGAAEYVALKNRILNPGATPETILFGEHKAKFTKRNLTDTYKRLAKLTHPDKNVDRKEEADEVFKVVSKAKELLEKNLT